jgi:hypothetical protein
MKKDVIATPLLPFTDEEEAALVERLAAMDSAALGHYVASAKLSLSNKALDPSWQPRIAVGLKRAEEALLTQSLMEPVVAEPPPPVAAKAAKTAKPKAAKTAKAKAVEA